MATKMASNSITVQELQRREKTARKPASGKAATGPSATTTKTAATKSSAPSAVAKEKMDRSKKLKEDLEAERKKRLEDKKTKERERVESIAEKRKAMEEKRKQDIAKKAAVKDQVTLGPRAVSKPSVKESSLKMGAKPSAPKPADATDGAKAHPGNKTTLSTASSRALATKKASPGPTASISATQEVTSNGTASVQSKIAVPSKIAKPAGHTTSRPVSSSIVAASKPSSSKVVPVSSRPSSTKAGHLAPKSTTSSSPGTKVASRVAPSSRPQSARAPSATTTAATSKTVLTKQAKPSMHSGVSSASSLPKFTTRMKTNAGSATSSSNVAKPSPAVTASSRTGTSSGKAASSSSPSSVLKTAGSGRGATSSVGVKKSSDVTKSPSRVPKAGAKAIIKTTSASSPKAATKSAGKPPTKVSGSKLTSSLGKKLDGKKSAKAITKKEEPIKHDDVQAPKLPVVDPEKGADDVPVSDVALAESRVLPDRNDVDEFPGTSVPTGSDVTAPHPVVDNTALSEPPVTFTPATAQRAGQIISSQTSLSKELQSKLPRLGDILDIVEGDEEEDKVPPRDNEPEHVEHESTELTSADGKDKLEGETETVGLPEAGHSEAAADCLEVVVETISTNLNDFPEDFDANLKLEEEEKQQQQEEEREERRKRVDEIMERTRAKGLEMCVMEEDMGQTREEDVDKLPSSNSPSLPIIPDPSSNVDWDISIDEEVRHERGTISAQDSFEFKLAYEQQEPLDSLATVGVVKEESEGSEQDREEEALDGTDVTAGDTTNDGEVGGMDIIQQEQDKSQKPQVVTELGEVEDRNVQATVDVTLASTIPVPAANLEFKPPSGYEEKDVVETNNQQDSLAETEAAQEDQQTSQLVQNEKHSSSPEHDVICCPFDSTLPPVDVTVQEEKQEEKVEEGTDEEEEEERKDEKDDLEMEVVEEEQQKEVEEAEGEDEEDEDRETFSKDSLNDVTPETKPSEYDANLKQYTFAIHTQYADEKDIIQREEKKEDGEVGEIVSQAEDKVMVEEAVVVKKEDLEQILDPASESDDRVVAEAVVEEAVVVEEEDSEDMVEDPASKSGERFAAEEAVMVEEEDLEQVLEDLAFKSGDTDVAEEAVVVEEEDSEQVPEDPASKSDDTVAAEAAVVVEEEDSEQMLEDPASKLGDTDVAEEAVVVEEEDSEQVPEDPAPKTGDTDVAEEAVVVEEEDLEQMPEDHVSMSGERVAAEESVVVEEEDSEPISEDTDPISHDSVELLEQIVGAEEDLTVGDGLDPSRPSADSVIAAHAMPVLASVSASSSPSSNKEDENGEVNDSKEGNKEADDLIEEVSDDKSATEEMGEVEGVEGEMAEVNEEVEAGEDEGEVENKDSEEDDSLLTFEEDEATSDILVMLPDDTDKEMQQLLEVAAQRIDKMESEKQQLLTEPAVAEGLTVGDGLDPSRPSGDGEITSETGALAEPEMSPISDDPLSGGSGEPPLLDFSDSNEMPRSEDQDGGGIADVTSAPLDIHSNPFSASPKASEGFDPFSFKSMPEEENATYPLLPPPPPTSEVPTDLFFNLEDCAKEQPQQPFPVTGTLATDGIAGGNLLSFEEDASI